jgi:hypothetical protein
MSKVGNWLNELADTVGRYISLETLDGMRREGRLSSINMRSIKWNGRSVDVLVELELNGDVYDVVPLNRISFLEEVR